MQLARARIRNFRSLQDVSVEFNAHTVFIGGNGAGKSSILKALEKFYSTVKSLDIDDYFGRDQTKEIEIELTFSDLTDSEAEAFESRVRDGRLTVTRIFDSTSGSGRYFGSVPANPDFATIRAIGTATPKRAAYNDLRTKNQKWAGLPSVNSVAQVDEALRAWENAHPNELILGRDDGQFFGFQNASRGALQKFTSFVFVPAVREASTDAADAKASAIGRLLEILVRSAILQRQDISQFHDEINTRYKQLTSPENMPELGALAGRLTSDIRELYADAEVGLSWRTTADMVVPLPVADVTLSDDGFGGPVDRQGHGIQRAFIFTLLQQLARASVNISNSEEAPPEIQVQAPSLILAIEEPELYQHPTKQRHFSSVLRKLSNGSLPGTEGRTQIAFASHSPMFVSIPNLEEIRFVRRTECEDRSFKQCKLKILDLNSVVRKLETALQKPPETYSSSSLMPRLHILSSELAEGFFADAVVLVEGRSDRAALFAAASLLDTNFESAGIAVLSVEGKGNIDRPLLIFRELGIPTNPIWDCDTNKPTKEAHPEQNLGLLRAADSTPGHTTAPTTTAVQDLYAHFSISLEQTLSDELTAPILYESLEYACTTFDYPAGRDAQKSPEIMKALLVYANSKGYRSVTLEAIIRRIWKVLKNKELS